MDTKGKPLLSTKLDKCELLSLPVVGMVAETHAGVHLFNKDDAEYMVIKNWLGGATLGMGCD